LRTVVDLPIVAEEERTIQAKLLRDIVGPLRPVPIEPSWRTESVLHIALGIYESRDFVGLPILADALEDAGCVQGLVLDHCRAGGDHARGCWVVDLLLAKDR
jgi:hypothetical protein